MPSFPDLPAPAFPPLLALRGVSCFFFFFIFS